MPALPDLTGVVGHVPRSALVGGMLAPPHCLGKGPVEAELSPDDEGLWWEQAAQPSGANTPTSACLQQQLKTSSLFATRLVGSLWVEVMTQSVYMLPLDTRCPQGSRDCCPIYGGGN